MTRTFYAMGCGVLLATSACGTDYPRTAAQVNCSAADGYDLKTIYDFEGSSGWYSYGDLTPGAMPPAPAPGKGSDVLVSDPDPPRCGSTGALKLVSYGNNYWGSGFGDWGLNSTPAIGKDDQGISFQGISFWARSAARSDKTFLLSVDDDQTFKTSASASDASTLPDGGILPPGVIRKANQGDQDLDGDGFLGPGDIASGTYINPNHPDAPPRPMSVCRLPPPQSIGDPACYYGGTQAPDAVTRVPEPGECGNSFHTWITVTEDWQLFLVPWSQLVQWPCPNRVAGGIHTEPIRGFQVKLMQGTHYELWLDDISFYRLRADADAGRPSE
jgi:hypothetical protein